MKQEFIKPEYIDAIKVLRPNSSFEISFNDYTTLKWFDSENIPPSEEEIIIAYNNLLKEYNSKEYYRLRGLNYPSVVEQLDTLFHTGYDGWKNSIQEIKDRYPKPSE